MTIFFEEELAEKIKSGVDICEYTEDELDAITYDFVIKETTLSDSTWYLYTQVVFKLGDEIFAINYNKPKVSKYHENEFAEKPYKVKKETELIIVEKYVKVEE